MTTVSIGVTVSIGEYDWSFRLPEATRVRLVTTSAMASAFTTLWIAAPAYLPFAEVDARLVLCGFAVPFGVGYVSLLLAERRARKELTIAARQKMVAEQGGVR